MCVHHEFAGLSLHNCDVQHKLSLSPDQLLALSALRRVCVRNILKDFAESEPYPRMSSYHVIRWPLLVVYWLHTRGFSFRRPLGLRPRIYPIKTAHSCYMYNMIMWRSSVGFGMQSKNAESTQHWRRACSWTWHCSPVTLRFPYLRAWMVEEKVRLCLSYIFRAFMAMSGRWAKETFSLVFCTSAVGFLGASQLKSWKLMFRVTNRILPFSEAERALLECMALTRSCHCVIPPPVYNW